MEEKAMKPGNGKIYVGIPRERIYLTQFVDNRDALITYLGQKNRLAGYFQAESHRVDRNRDHIVEEFLKCKKKPEWLLFIDTDMEHPIDCGIRLTSHGKPIVGALYFARGPTNHTPFVFKEMENPKNDQYGRPTLAWMPQSKLVFNYLTANKVPMRDGALTIDDSAVESLVECDAVATGCTVIHRSVIEDMPKPIFEYRERANSEDLIFCREAKARGWPIYADLSTICGHFHWVPMGQAQFRMNFINDGINSTTYSKRMAAEWYSQFFHISMKKAIAEIEAGSEMEVRKAWNELFAGREPTPEEVDAFYRDPEVGKLYVMELLHWNFSLDFNHLKQFLVSIRDLNVIEIGAGIGSVALQMILQENNVLAVEVNPVLREFIDMRYKGIKEDLFGEMGELSVVSSEWKENCADASFDVGMAFDVFEHLSLPELEVTIKTLSRVIKKEGRLVFHNNWNVNEAYPMHYDHKEQFIALLRDNGFVFLNEMEAVHV